LRRLFLPVQTNRTSNTFERFYLFKKRLRARVLSRVQKRDKKFHVEKFVTFCPTSTIFILFSHFLKNGIVF